MKRWLGVALAAAAMALVPTTAAADSGEHGDGNRAIFGPYSSGSTDSGTCGPPDWADDTFKRVFYVQQTGATTWYVTEVFVDGRFVTVEGRSPGACNTLPGNEHRIRAGVTGKFGGFAAGTVTSDSYNPDGCDVPATCSTSTGFILAVFGELRTAWNDSTFRFDYRAHDEGLVLKHWTNASANLGGNRGDIASS